ncbi:hypothetical protein GQX73_g5291 [Xylaria multiplex]|uniref:Peptidase M20 dimerisation domain-containing protein n=1 Tax=Xylaria multiplex TaxID=323545 RepID=A0A7C8MUF0_9PEZI|nr:hypothetical protein GQX73_g5291 [Xylaria multiplex]
MTCFASGLLARSLLMSVMSACVFAYGNQYSLGSGKPLAVEDPGYISSRLKCDLPRSLDPSSDGLLSSFELFSGKDALETIIKRHQELVRIPSICYDDLGEFDEDKRWEPFYDIPDVLEKAYPNIYESATVETINRFGLVYTVSGSDRGLAPILLVAHQDVVPVEEETLDQWEHPPFDAVYNETDGYLWGRGASDDKSAITALMSAMEALLSQEEYQPRRSVIFAFGFDEECSGYRGAGEISKHLEERYGEGGIAVILDEGGGGLQSLGDTLYALPAVYEKGYLDVWFTLDVLGGHSSTPTPHTAIGIMSEIITTLESNPFEPIIIKNSPVHQALVCLARYSPGAIPKLTEFIYHGNLKAAAYVLAQASRETQYLIQTSQAVDWIAGGQKINSLPEFVTLGVNHRYAPQDSITGIQHRIVNLVDKIVRKYALQLRAFEDDEDYDKYLATTTIPPQGQKAHHLWEPIYNGTLMLETRKKSYITPETPTHGPIWDTFAGTVRHTFAREASKVVVAPGAMTGNTDTRHYLSK